MIRDISSAQAQVCAYLADGSPSQREDTVALIDDRRLMRDCFALLLEQQAADLCVVTFSRVEEIDLEELSLAVIWIDERSSEAGRHIADRVSVIRRRFPTAAIAAFVECEDSEAIKTAINLGLTLLAFETATRNIAVAAIRLAIAGGIFAPPELLLKHLSDAERDNNPVITGRTSALIDSNAAESTRLELPPNFDPRYEQQSPSYKTDSAEDAIYCRFTRRELEILVCLNKGLQNKTIAFELGISDSTVKVHLRNIMKKLHATNRTQAIFLMRQLSVNPLSPRPSGRESCPDTG